MNRSLIFCLLAMLILACSHSENSQEYLVRLKTDKNTYSADTSTTIFLNVLNMGRSPVYFICTGQIILEEFENDSLKNHWLVHGFEKCGSVTPIKPNSAKLFNLTFLNWPGLPDARFSEEVQYKLHFILFVDQEIDHALSDNDEISDYIKIIKE